MGTNFVRDKNELEKGLSKLDKESFYLSCKKTMWLSSEHSRASNMVHVWKCHSWINRSVMSCLCTCFKTWWHLIGSFFYEDMSIANVWPLSTNSINDLKRVKQLTLNHFLRVKTSVIPGRLSKIWMLEKEVEEYTT